MWSILQRQVPPAPRTFVNPPPPFPILVLVVYGVWLLYLLAAKNNRVMHDPSRLKQLWLCWPLSLGSYAVSRYSLSQDTPIGTGRDLSDALHSLIFALPIAGFGLLLMSEFTTWFFATLGPQRAFAPLRHPVMSVHAISFLYYVDEPGTETCLM